MSEPRRNKPAAAHLSLVSSDSSDPVRRNDARELNVISQGMFIMEDNDDLGLSRSEGFERLVVTPREACQMLSVGLTRLYELLHDNELDSYRDGGSRRITVASI